MVNGSVTSWAGKTRRPRAWRLLCCGAALLAGCGEGPEAGPDGTRPETPPAIAEANAQGEPSNDAVHGFDQAGLEALEDELSRPVSTGELAGVVTMLIREDELVHRLAVGMRDTEAGDPIEEDTIFRIASMTKPITAVAMMMLWEEGRWALDDPVSDYVPAFAELTVRAEDGTTRQPASQMTMRQLMSHTAGFDVSAGYAEDGLADGDLAAMIEKLADLPLATDPGTAWDYGPSVNVQGYIVEQLSGQTLAEFFEERVFEPLDMEDTGFFVSEEKQARLSRLYEYDREGALAPLPPDARNPNGMPAFLSGSGGLFSTAADYASFARMLLNGGELEGQRLLEEETVALMTTSVLPEGVDVDLYGPAMDGVGFGLGVAVIDDPSAAATPQGEGAYYWGGAFGTWFWIDPANDLAFVGMIQNVDGSRPDRGTPPVRARSIDLVYEALRE